MDINNNNSFARQNNASKATVQNQVVYASGGFKNVYKGNYTEGERKDEECVAKVFKSGSIFEQSYFATELKVVAKAMAILLKLAEI
jgi:hypothetical protein